jgi:predicted ATPase/DNA-binding SARP family transcriptional activator
MTSESVQQTESVWRIDLFAGLRLSRNGSLAPPFKTRRMTRLLARLACFPDRAHARDILAEELWPEEDPEAIRDRFRQTLALLRRELEPPGTPSGSVLIADRSTVQLAPRSFTTDIAEFAAALRTASVEPDLLRQIVLLRQAVALYRGELLPGFDEDWIQAERLHLAERGRQALVRLTEALTTAGEWDEAIETARRAIAADPLHEEAHATLIRLFARAGRPADADRQYEEMARLLKAAINLEPSPATTDLMRQIRAGLLPHTAVAPSTRAVASAPLENRSAALLAATLPAPMTRFYGREPEIERLTALLSLRERKTDLPPLLVTVTGPGGAGKTRLALEAARRVRSDYGQAVWFVPLADVSTPEWIPDAVCEALGVLRSAQADASTACVEALKASSPALLIFDNFEHLQEQEHGTDFLQTLRGHVPHLSCLVTSRHKLNLDGERHLPLLPLQVPEGASTAEQLQRYPSVQLFLDRAQAARYSFVLTPSNTQAIAALVQRLEGLPLAIELAAAWAATLTPEQILARLSRRFELLVTRRKDAPQRHRSLQAVLEGSVQLLPPWLQTLYSQLSVFRGGWTLEAVEAIATSPATRNDSATLPYLEGLALLHERSFVHMEERGAEMRYSLLESIREFGAEQLTVEEGSALAQRHAAYFLKLAKEARSHLRLPDEKEWFDQLEAESDNLRTALDWALAEEPETALHIAALLPHFWMTRGRAREGSDWLHKALHSSSEMSVIRADALIGLALMKWALSEYDEGKRWAYASLDAHRALNDPQGMAKALNILGSVRMEQGHYAEARAAYEECLGLFRTVGDRLGESNVLANLGNLAYGEGDYAPACLRYEASLEARRALGDQRGIASVLDYMARAARELGDYRRAFDLHAESLAMRREINDKQGVALSLNHAAFAKILLGEGTAARVLLEEGTVYAREIGDKAALAEALSLLGELANRENAMTTARACWSESLTLWQEAGDRASLATLFESVAALACSEAQYAEAAQLLAAATALRAEISSPRLPSGRTRYEQTAATVRTALGVALFQQATDAGRALPLSRTIDLTRSLLTDR